MRNGGIDAESGEEHEVPVARLSCVDQTPVSVHHALDGFDGLVVKIDLARPDVAGAAGDRSHRGLASDKAVGDFVDAAIATRDAYAAALAERGKGPITTEIAEAGTYYPAEDYHQQYLHKVPNGYCGLKGTGVSCAIPAAAA